MNIDDVYRRQEDHIQATTHMTQIVVEILEELRRPKSDVLAQTLRELISVINAQTVIIKELQMTVSSRR